MASFYTNVKNNGRTVSATSVKQAFILQLVCTSKHQHNSKYDRPSQVSSEAGTSKFYPTWNTTISAGDVKTQGSGSHTFNRTKADRTVKLKGYIYRTNTGASSTGYLSCSVPAREHYKVTLQSESTEFDSFDKYYGYDETITTDVPTKSGFKFVKWQDSNNNDYYAGDTFSANLSADATLTAIWSADNPPTCDETHEYENVDTETEPQPYEHVIKNFSNLKVKVENAKVNYEGRSISSIVLSIGNAVSTTGTASGTYTVIPTQSGTFPLKLKITDSAGAYSEYVIATVEVVDPTWTFSPKFNVSDVLVPDTDSSGKAKLTLQARKYTSGTAGSYEDIDGTYAVKKLTEGGVAKWSVDVVVGEDYVSNTTSSTPTADFQIKSATHTDTDEKDYSKAFFNTTRNASYSNGIYNNMFVGGCDALVAPDYTSRVWWSKINDPLYFPDTNYAEVGSNDTAIQGLVKVGDYLGAVKQSKTTDTAIFLLYPTSFEEETTFAIKQGVQGVGALGKYTFNVLGDETLFLSPDGVVAIAPSEDDDHKVQNRSFYVDGKLLKEYSADSGYSFVHDGKYWLSLGTKMYVLDGNQKNSWGNDKTNLVYEAYYLENIPANCIVKYNDELWFSNADNLCRFKNDGEANAYTDGYDIETGETNVTVKAEWSTILDDDGSLHYLKTMQKKGNVASIYPIDGEATSAEVYIKKDAEEPIYVGEINGEVEETGDIPNELHIRKKVKKYKRLQFILKNEKDEGFGVDSITKSYYLGNYAK